MDAGMGTGWFYLFSLGTLLGWLGIARDWHRRGIQRLFANVIAASSPTPNGDYFTSGSRLNLLMRLT